MVKWFNDSGHKLMALAAITALLLLACGLHAAEDAAEQDPVGPATMAGFAKQTDSQLSDTDCRVTFCTSDLRKVLIQNAKGAMVLDARSLKIDIPRLGDRPTVTCKLYTGIYEPSGAAVRNWTLSEMRFVEAEEFQKIVDEANEKQAALMQPGFRSVPLAPQPQSATIETGEPKRDTPPKTEVNKPAEKGVDLSDAVPLSNGSSQK